MPGETLESIQMAVPGTDSPLSLLTEIMDRWGKEDANDVLADMEGRIAAVKFHMGDFLTIPEPKFDWAGMKNGMALQWNRVTIGGVHPAPANPGDVGPWFGYVGQGFPHPFEGYFGSEDDAKEMVEKAARHLLGLRQAMIVIEGAA